MHIIKSAFVIIFLLVCVLFSAKQIHKCYKFLRYGGDSYWLFPVTIVCCVITVFALTFLLDYTYPFDRDVEIELVTVVDIEGDQTPIKGPGTWFGIYGEIGLHAASVEYHPNFIDKYIDSDLEHYSYIISYGVEVYSLSYNVWEDVGGTYGAGIHKGHIVFADDFNQWKIYIYRIPRLRIDN